jgi:hypothetical protein
LILFSLPFALIGAGATVLLAMTYLEYLAVGRWEEVPATIVRTELKTHPGDKGGCTYEATAEYTYTHGVRNYTSKRVSLYHGSDNVGSFHQQVYRELKQHQTSGQPLRCYVNPSKPSEAILYRNLRGEMMGLYGLLAVAFGGVGFGLLGTNLYRYRKSRRRGFQATEFPDQPWLWREDWARGEIKTGDEGSMLALGILATVWNLVSLPALFFVFQQGYHWRSWPGLLALLGAFVGLLLLLVAGFAILSWCKYGESVFQMATVPGVIGGKLAGVVLTSARVRPEKGFRVILCCKHRFSTGTDKDENRRPYWLTLWKDEQTITHGLSEADFTKTAIPILFAIPYDAQPSDFCPSDNYISWHLTVTADVPGLDYGASFEVPVFKPA